MLTDGTGLPLTIEHTAANVHDSQLLIPLVDAIPDIKSPRGPARRRPFAVLADAAYDAEAKIRVPLRQRRIKPLIRRRTDDHGSGLGELRYVVESCMEWLFLWRRLRLRYEKRDDIHTAFLHLACAMICFNRISKLT